MTNHASESVATSAPRRPAPRRWLARTLLAAMVLGMLAAGGVWGVVRLKHESRRQAIQGTWRSLDSDDTIEFHADGTTWMHKGDRSETGRYAWTGDDEVTLTNTKPISVPAQPLRPSVAERDLILTAPDGKSYGYRRTMADGTDKALELYQRGQRDQQAGRIGKAIDAFELALDADPQFSQARLARAKALLTLRHFELARTEFDRLLAQLPNLAEGYYLRGLTRVDPQQNDRALADFNRALALAPDYVDALVARGAARQFADQIPQATADFDRAVSLAPKNGKARLSRALLYLQQKKLDQAIADYDEIIRFHPENAAVLLLRGEAHIQQKDFPAALDDYRRAGELAPESVSACYGQAWLLATCPDDSLRNGARALELAKKGDELAKHRDAYLQSAVAAAYAETGNFDEAIAWERKALQARPDDMPFQQVGIRRLEAYSRGKAWRDETTGK